MKTVCGDADPILPVLLALFLLSTPANAEAQLYGSLRSGVEYVHIHGAGSPVSTQFRVADQTSRIGAQGSDPLGDGWAAIWRVENRLHIGDPNKSAGNDLWGSRNTYVGLQSPFGSLKAGQDDDAYKTSTGTLTPAFDDTFNASTDPFGNGELIRRLGQLDNSIIGFRSTLLYGLGLNLSIGHIGKQGGNYNPLSLAATAYYQGERFRIGGGWKTLNDTSSRLSSKLTLKDDGSANNPGDKLSAFDFGMNYSCLNWSSSIYYERTATHYAGAQADQDDMAAALVYKKDRWAIYASYIRMLDVQGDVSAGAGPGTGASQYNLAGYYVVAPKTRLVVSIVKLENGAHASFNQSSGVNVKAGQSFWIFTTGLRADF
ncbi:porin [Andreprevotia chitinilytica]|uniref:porin n=1 Tax=Andreprevotia chitinilytica TaxID=396808 RepID=UPI0005568040|nr:porin [Andreprevotia chitinilytica]